MEREALKLRRQYRIAMEEYRKTDQSKEYQEYLAMFKRTQQNQATTSSALQEEGDDGDGDGDAVSVAGSTTSATSMTDEASPSMMAASLGTGGTSSVEAPQSPPANYGYGHGVSVAQSPSPFRQSPLTGYSGEIGGGEAADPYPEAPSYQPQQRQFHLPSMHSSPISGSHALPYANNPMTAGTLPSPTFQRPTAQSPTIPSSPLPLPPQQLGPGGVFSAGGPTSLLPYSLSYDPRASDETRGRSGSGANPPSPTQERLG